MHERNNVRERQKNASNNMDPHEQNENFPDCPTNVGDESEFAQYVARRDTRSWVWVHMQLVEDCN